MNIPSGGPITPGMERASNFCRYMLPIYESGKVNPLEALETGAANCAIRAFTIATILEELEGRTGFFIHANHGIDYEIDGEPVLGHTVTLFNGSRINTNDNPQAIDVSPVNAGSRFYKNGMLVHGDPAYGLIQYINMSPYLPSVPESDILEAQAQIRDSL